jgi:hypothetical protein
VHQSGNDALLLLPVSNVRFWLLPFTAASCAGIAIVKGRKSSALVSSAVLFVVLCVASTVHWYRVGVRLGPRWTTSDARSAVDDVGLARVFLGSLTLLGCALFFLGVRDSLTENREA